MASSDQATAASSPFAGLDDHAFLAHIYSQSQDLHLRENRHRPNLAPADALSQLPELFQQRRKFRVLQRALLARLSSSAELANLVQSLNREPPNIRELAYMHNQPVDDLKVMRQPSSEVPELLRPLDPASTDPSAPTAAATPAASDLDPAAPLSQKLDKTLRYMSKVSRGFHNQVAAYYMTLIEDNPQLAKSTDVDEQQKALLQWLANEWKVCQLEEQHFHPTSDYGGRMPIPWDFREVYSHEEAIDSTNSSSTLSNSSSTLSNSSSTLSNSSSTLSNSADCILS